MESVGGQGTGFILLGPDCQQLDATPMRSSAPSQMDGAVYSQPILPSGMVWMDALAGEGAVGAIPRPCGCPRRSASAIPMFVHRPG